MNLSQLITELKEKAAKATPKCTWVAKKGSYKDRYWVDGTKHSDGAFVAIFTKVEAKHIAACSPQTIATLCEALEDARELAEYSREHGERNLTGRNEQYLLAEKARAFLAKYFPKGEHERR